MATSQVSCQQGKDPAPIPTAAALLSPSSTPCCYCHQTHFSNKCGTLTICEDREQILSKSGRCFICLENFHVSDDSPSLSRCRKCGGRHHSIVCLKGSPRNVRSDKPPMTSHTESHPPAQRTVNTPSARAKQQPGLNPQAN